MFTHNSFIKQKIRDYSWKVFNSIENNGNCTFETNGEKKFIENLFQIFAKEKKFRIIFDIGANVGKYSLMIQDRAVNNNIQIQLHLFEPTSACIKELKKIFHQSNIFLNHFGLSDKDEIREIFYDLEKSSLASLYKRNLDHYSIHLNKKEKIQVKRACDYIELHGIKHIDYCKIDIEGHELFALKGFGKYINSDFISYIQLEYGGANLDSHVNLLDFYSFLNEKGFLIAKIMPNGLEIRDYHPFMENFIYSNYIAISKRALKEVYP